MAFSTGDTADVSQTVTLFESQGTRIVFLDMNVDIHLALAATHWLCYGYGL